MVTVDTLELGNQPKVLRFKSNGFKSLFKTNWRQLIGRLILHRSNEVGFAEPKSEKGNMQIIIRLEEWRQNVIGFDSQLAKDTSQLLWFMGWRLKDLNAFRIQQMLVLKRFYPIDF